jgi:hypothetical protein
VRDVTSSSLSLITVNPAFACQNPYLRYLRIASFRFLRPTGRQWSRNGRNNIMHSTGDALAVKSVQAFARPYSRLPASGGHITHSGRRRRIGDLAAWLPGH